MPLLQPGPGAYALYDMPLLFGNKRALAIIDFELMDWVMTGGHPLNAVIDWLAAVNAREDIFVDNMDSVIASLELQQHEDGAIKQLEHMSDASTGYISRLNILKLMIHMALDPDIPPLPMPRIKYTTWAYNEPAPLIVEPLGYRIGWFQFYIFNMGTDLEVFNARDHHDLHSIGHDHIESTPGIKPCIWSLATSPVNNLVYLVPEYVPNAKAYYRANKPTNPEYKLMAFLYTAYVQQYLSTVPAHRTIDSADVTLEAFNKVLVSD